MLPEGVTAASLRAQLPGSHWDEGEGVHFVSLLNRPSWLLGDTLGLREFMQRFYHDTDWVMGAVTVRGTLVTLSDPPPTAPASAHTMHALTQVNGLAKGLWVNCRAVFGLLSAIMGDN